MVGGYSERRANPLYTCLLTCQLMHFHLSYLHTFLKKNISCQSVQILLFSISLIMQLLKEIPPIDTSKHAKQQSFTCIISGLASMEDEVLLWWSTSQLIQKYSQFLARRWQQAFWDFIQELITFITRLLDFSFLIYLDKLLSFCVKAYHPLFQDGLSK